MTSDVEPIANGRVVDAVFCGLLESETEIVTVYVPELVVPLIKPLEALYVKLRGNPVMVHTNGKVPPDVSGWKLYGVPDVPCGREVVVMVRPVAGPTVKGQVTAAATPWASFTWMVNVPVALGVPVMAPVEVFRVRPAGSVPLASEKV
jgi:hypothetical protein